MKSYPPTQTLYLEERLTKQHIDRYFTRQRFPKSFGYFLFFSITLTFIAGIARIQSLVAICAGLLLLSFLYFIWRLKSIPTHKHYDEWLEKVEKEFDRHSRDRLQREHGKRVPRGICLHTFVLPDTELFARYALKKFAYRTGKDQSLRFSFIVLTFLYPTEGYVVMFTYRIDVLNQYKVIVERKRACPYTQIFEFTTSISRGSARLNNLKYSYRMERVLLQATHSTIEIGAYSCIEPTGENRELAPHICTNVEPVIDYLNGVVMSKWR